MRTRESASGCNRLDYHLYTACRLHTLACCRYHVLIDSPAFLCLAAKMTAGIGMLDFTDKADIVLVCPMLSPALGSIIPGLRAITDYGMMQELHTPLSRLLQILTCVPARCCRFVVSVQFCAPF